MTKDEIIAAMECYISRREVPTSDPQMSRSMITAINIKEIADHIELRFMRKDARIDELLHTNNEYLERARVAERLNDELKLSIAGCARLFGQLAVLIKDH